MTSEKIVPQQLLAKADLVHDAETVQSAIHTLADKINASLHDQCPLVLAVMGGAVTFAGQLLPQLSFPLEFDYVQVSRYHNQTAGQHLIWKVMPGANVRERTVLLLDDILDEGYTLDAVRQKCLELGARQVKVAVLVEKDIAWSKPIQADFVGLRVPDRYVFGCGMDVYGWWRNLPAIYALPED